MMYEIKLSIKDYAAINIYTTSDKIKDKLVAENSSLRRTIPVTKVSYKEVSTNDIVYEDSVIINSSFDKRMIYDKEYNVAVCNAHEDDFRFPDLVYICLAMFSKILSRNQRYLLHSSALLHESGNSFILVGEANAGKTSLAYELMCHHNCKLISNDHSVIGVEDGKVKLLGGTKEIQMRLGAIELYFPELFKRINVSAEDKWAKKIVVNDYVDTNLILDSNTDSATLTDLFSIYTINAGDSFIRQKGNIDEFLFLYDSMSKIIKGTYNYITGFDYPMPSMESEKSLTDLSSLCHKIVDQCDVYDARGSICHLGKELVKKYER